MILALVIRHIYKLSSRVEVGRDAVAAKNKVNGLVTGSHIVVTLAYSIAQFDFLLEHNNTTVFRMDSAFYFFGGLADIFLSVMLWFILDSEKPAIVLVDNDRVFAVEEITR